MTVRLPYDYQATLDAVVEWCCKNDTDKFTGKQVQAPKGHLRGLASRGRVRRDGKGWELLVDA